MHSLLVLLAALFASSPQPRVLTTEFTYTATVGAQTPSAKALDLWIPVPSDSPWQRIYGLKIDAPARYRLTQERQYGNRMAFIHIEKPSAPVTVTVRFTVDRKEVHLLGSDA